jgi:UPF0176 protein
MAKKKQLRNLLSKEEALKRVAAEKFPRTTISFYKYVAISDPKTFRDQLYALWDALGVLGRIYVAKEGINAQLSVPAHNEAALRASVDFIPELCGTMFKYALEEPNISFWKLTVKVREHIVAHGIEEEIDLSKTGMHLDAAEWNEAIAQGAIVVDMRNGYETDIGHFDGAITPKVDTFREEIPVVLEMLADQKDKKILLYCTGGVRCEPVSAYMAQKGFKDVNQLNGGIIKYAEEVQKKGLENKFLGQNYVFDGRVAEKITDDVLGKCFNCKNPCNTHVDCESDLCHALFLQCADCQTRLKRCCSTECMEFASLPKEERVLKRKGRKAKFLIHRAESPANPL